MIESINTKDASSVQREKDLKDPFILEHNIMGEKFRKGEIRQAQWFAYKEDWRIRFNESVTIPALKLRTYK